MFTAYHKAGSYYPAKFASVFYNSSLEDGRLSRENLVGRLDVGPVKGRDMLGDMQQGYKRG